MALVEGTNCGFVTVAPSGDPGGSLGTNDNTAHGFKSIAPAGATTVTEIGFYIPNATEEANFEAGIYTHDVANNRPENLVGTATATYGPGGTNAKGTSGGVWIKVTGLNVSITEGTTYWICKQLDDTATATQNNYAADAGERQINITASTLPNPWASGTSSAYMIALYAVYTTSTAWAKALSNSVTVTETLTSGVGKVLSNTLTTGNTLSNKPQKVISEAVTITDSLTKLFYKVKSESVTITETSIKKFFKVLSDSSTITDSSIKNIFKSISESITTTDSVGTSFGTKFIKTRYITGDKKLKPHELEAMKNWLNGLTYKDINIMKKEFLGGVSNQDLVRMNSDLKELLKDW